MKNINELLDITSDLNTDFIYKNFKTIYWENWVLKQKNKYLIIAWDINENIHVLKMSLDDVINNSNYEKIIITFGNHDLRLNIDDEDFSISNSIEKYEFLIDYFHDYRNKIHVIDKEDFIIPNTNYIITWVTWWYNYTIRNEDRFYLEKYYHANFNKMSFWWITYNDRNYIKFNNEIKSNEEFARYLENKLIQKLEQIKSNYNNYEIIAISHVKPSRLLEKDSQYHIEYSFEQWEEIIKDWMKWIKLYWLDKIYGNAFFVNNNLSKIYEKYWVKYSIYGHTHYKWNEEINWIEYITNTLWYYWLS